MKVYRVVTHLKEAGGERENKEIVPCFQKFVLLSVHVCVLSTQPNAEMKSLYFTCFDIGLYHYNVNVCMNT